MIKFIGLLLVAVFLASSSVLAEPNSEEIEALSKELAKDLNALNEVFIIWQQILEKMSPEEIKQWGENDKEKIEKAMPTPMIMIKFDCDWLSKENAEELLLGFFIFYTRGG